jgi:alcohol dehydrogenase (cytochrome c)
LRPLDPTTGKIKWEWKHPLPTWAGVLSTAGGLVFTGDAEGHVLALDATTGKALWDFQCGSSDASALFAFGLP